LEKAVLSLATNEFRAVLVRQRGAGNDPLVCVVSWEVNASCVTIVIRSCANGLALDVRRGSVDDTS
jgi:hypothetical protein